MKIQKYGIFVFSFPESDHEIEKFILSYRPFIYNKSMIYDSLTFKVVRFTNSLYFGESLSNLLHGYGVMIYKNGRIYEGDWFKNYKHGQGYEQFESHSIYHGNYCKGLPHGHGIYKWSNGDYYKGEWV